nr:MAG TPA: hypothetical protein [Caudoviricetes sp.]
MGGKPKIATPQALYGGLFCTSRPIPLYNPFRRVGRVWCALMVRRICKGIL